MFLKDYKMPKEFRCKCGFILETKAQGIEEIVCPLCNTEVEPTKDRKKELVEADEGFRKRYFEKREAKKRL